MNARIVRSLVILFPRSWQKRYGPEFILFLQERRLSLFVIFNVVGCAAHQHFRNAKGISKTHGNRSFLLMGYACVAAFVGGVNLYWTVDDTPLGPAMRSHRSWLGVWNIIAGGTVLALAIAGATALPITWKLFRSANVARRHDVLLRIAFTPAAAVVLILWLGIAFFLLGGHWLPTPWDISGDWTAPGNWPPLATRWIFGSITLALLGVVLIGGVVSLRRALALGEKIEPKLAGHGLLSTRIAAAVLAGTSLMTTLGVSAWMLLAQRYEPIAFHAHFGGFMDSTTCASCLGSGLLFAIATVIAFRAARRVEAVSRQ